MDGQGAHQVPWKRQARLAGWVTFLIPDAAIALALLLIGMLSGDWPSVSDIDEFFVFAVLSLLPGILVYQAAKRVVLPRVGGDLRAYKAMSWVSFTRPLILWLAYTWDKGCCEQTWYSTDIVPDWGEYWGEWAFDALFSLCYLMVSVFVLTELIGIARTAMLATQGMVDPRDAPPSWETLPWANLWDTRTYALAKATLALSAGGFALCLASLWHTGVDRWSYGTSPFYDDLDGWLTWPIDMTLICMIMLVVGIVAGALAVSRARRGRSGLPYASTALFASCAIGTCSLLVGTSVALLYAAVGFVPLLATILSDWGVWPDRPTGRVVLLAAGIALASPVLAFGIMPVVSSLLLAGCVRRRMNLVRNDILLRAMTAPLPAPPATAPEAPITSVSQP